MAFRPYHPKHPKIPNLTTPFSSQQILEKKTPAISKNPKLTEYNSNGHQLPWIQTPASFMLLIQVVNLKLSNPCGKQEFVTVCPLLNLIINSKHAFPNTISASKLKPHLILLPQESHFWTVVPSRTYVSPTNQTVISMIIGLCRKKS